MPDDQVGLWPAVRRALSRWVSDTQVQELPVARLIPRPDVLRSDALAGLAPALGEPDWRPTAQAAVVPLPETWAGAGGADLTPAVRVVSLNPIFRAEAGVVRAARLPPLACTIHRLTMTDALAQSLVVDSSSIVLTAGAAVQPSVRFAAPETACLRVEAPALPRGPRLRGLGRRAGPVDPWRPAGVRVRSGASILGDVPLRRARLAVPPGATAAVAFAAERHRLAQAAGVAEDDLVLLGVFPQVPVAAVRRLAFEKSDTLSLWLKPDALVAAAAGRTPRLATLIVGRQRSTGKIIQTVA